MQVVAAKFTAAMAFYMVLWLPLLGCILLLEHYARDSAAVDPGVLASSFLGIFLLGCMFISLGCFASALTRSQMSAAMISTVLVVGMFMLSFLPDKVPAANWASQVLSCFAIRDQMHDFVRGVVDTRAIVFYLSVTLLFLFLTLRVIESRRWK
jgi:ABC-2 type transport system permease protein